MKEYLGLGVVFSAIDKGLSKSLRFAIKDMDDLDKKVEQTKKTSDNGGKKGGIFQGLFEGMKLLSISHIGSTLSDMHDAMSGVGGGIEDTFKKLDTLKTKLAFTFDGTQAQSLNNALLITMKNFGLTGDQIEIMADGMMQFGRSADEANKSLPMMGKMVGILGMDAEKVTTMFGQGLATLKATPDALSGVIKEVVAIQKAYHLTDQVSQLPEIFDTVTKNSALFGKVNAQTALTTVRSVAGLSAVFQKVGMSQQKALSASTGFQDKLSSLSRSVSDLKAGLDPLDNDLYDAAHALTMMGYNGEEAFKKILEGKSNPEKLADELNKTFSTLGKDQQDAVAARLRRIFGDDLTNIIAGYGDEARKAFNMDKTVVKGPAADKTFDQYTKALGGTVNVQQQLTDSSKAYMEVMTEFVNKDKTIKVLEAQRKGWNDLSAAVTDADSILGKVINTLTLFKNLGMAGFITALAPIGIMLGLLTPLIFPLANIVSLLKMLGALPFRIIAGGMSMIFSGPGLAIAGLLAGLTLLMTVFKDDLPELSAFAQKIFGGISDFIEDTFNGLNFEKITETASQFFKDLIPMAKAAFGFMLNIGEKTLSYFMDALKVVAPAFDKAFEVVISVFGKIWTNINSIIDGIKSMFFAFKSGDISDGIFGGAVSMVEDFNGLLESSEDTLSSWIKQLSGFTDLFSGAFEFIGGLLSSILNLAGNFYKGLFGGIVDNMPEIVSTFKAFKSAASGAFSAVMMVVSSLAKAFGGLLGYFGVTMNGFSGLNDMAQLVGFALGKTFSAIAVTLGTIINVALGLVSAFGKILDVSATIAAALAFAFTSPIDAMKMLAASVSDLFSTIFDSVSQQWEDFWSGLLDKIPDYVKSFLGIDVAKAIKLPDVTTIKQLDISSSQAPAVTPSAASLSNPSAVSGTDSMAQTQKIIPIKQQPGVPAAPTFNTFADQKPQQVEDPNIQALLNEVSNLTKLMSKLGQAIVDRPVVVEIKGDVKRFFQAVNQQQKNQMGTNMAGGSF